MAYINSSYMNIRWAAVKNPNKPKMKLNANALMLKKGKPKQSVTLEKTSSEKKNFKFVSLGD